MRFDYDFLGLDMHGNKKVINKGKGATWSLKDPRNRAKMAIIAKMEKNDKK